MHNEGLLKEAETMTEKSAFDKALGELHDLIEWAAAAPEHLRGGTLIIEKGSMFKAWEATTEQQKKTHEMQAIYKAQETARQAIREAMNRYIKKKTRARSVAKAEADPFAELEGWESLDQIQEAYGYGEITSDRRDKLTDLWEAREAAQRKGKKDGKYHDLVTDMLARAIHSVGNEYADEIAAYEEERRMRRSYYEKVENRANGGASDDGEESDH